MCWSSSCACWYEYLAHNLDAFRQRYDCDGRDDDNSDDSNDCDDGEKETVIQVRERGVLFMYRPIWCDDESRWGGQRRQIMTLWWRLEYCTDEMGLQYYVGVSASLILFLYLMLLLCVLITWCGVLPKVSSSSGWGGVCGAMCIEIVEWRHAGKKGMRKKRRYK